MSLYCLQQKGEKTLSREFQLLRNFYHNPADDPLPFHIENDPQMKFYLGASHMSQPCQTAVPRIY